MTEPQQTSAGETGRREASGAPLCDRISEIASQLEASITDLRGLPGASRPRLVLNTVITDLRNIAERVLEQESELDDERQRAEAAEGALEEMRGRLRDEWGWTWAGHDRIEGECSNEETARSLANHDDTIMRRVVGEWKAANGG